MEYDLNEKLADGKPRYQVNSIGAVQDMANGGKIITIDPSKNPNAITPANSRAMLARKKQIAVERAIQGIDQAAIEAGRIPKDAQRGAGWQAVVKHVASTLLKSSNLRGQAEAANFLGKASGFAIQETNGDSIAERLSAILSNFERDIIEGEVVK